MRKRSVIVALLALLILPSLTFGNDAVRLERLWQYTVRNYAPCRTQPQHCILRPGVVYTSGVINGRPGVLGTVTFESPNVVIVKSFLDPQEENTVLVHEFVHVIQHRMKTVHQNACSLADAEKEAYAVSAAYQRLTNQRHVFNGASAVYVLTELCKGEIQ